jgi:hypothetical protein
MTDKTASQTISPRGAAYCDTPGTSCFYNDSDDCINCGRHKGWRRAAKSNPQAALMDLPTYDSLVDALTQAHPEDLINIISRVLMERDDVSKDLVRADEVPTDEPEEYRFIVPGCPGDADCPPGEAHEQGHPGVPNRLFTIQIDQAEVSRAFATGWTAAA